jgi:hypothetical protein
VIDIHHLVETSQFDFKGNICWERKLKVQSKPHVEMPEDITLMCRCGCRTQAALPLAALFWGSECEGDSLVRHENTAAAQADRAPFWTPSQSSRNCSRLQFCWCTLCGCVCAVKCSPHAGCVMVSAALPTAQCLLSMPCSYCNHMGI